LGRLALAMVSILALSACTRRPSNRFLGDWAATSNAGSISQRLILHLRRDSHGRLTASTDNLDPGIWNLSCKDVTLKGNNFSFNSKFGSQVSTFTGKFSGDGRMLRGISKWRDLEIGASARRQLFDNGSGTVPIVFKYQGKLGINVEPSLV